MKKNNFKIVELKTEKNKSSVKRSVLVKNFIIQEIIGIHEHEKIKKQKIKFNIVIDVDQNILPDEKDIKSIIDYEKITNNLKNLAKSKKYNFLESLAEDSFKEYLRIKEFFLQKLKLKSLKQLKVLDQLA